MRTSRFLLTMAASSLFSMMAGAADLTSLIRGGDRQAVIDAIRGGADVNAAQGDGSTPLLWAVHRLDHELVKLLLERGASPDARNALGATPLAGAVNLGDVEMVRLLLQGKANPDLGNDDDQTPLMIAARMGSLPMAELLVKAGAKVNIREKLRDQTALMWAVGTNTPSSSALADLLIRHKAEVDIRAAVIDWGNQLTSEPRAQYRPAGGLTPLLYATRSGCLDCVKSLLKAGADINRPSPEGVTPLMNAIDNANYAIANLLLDEGANPHLFDWWSRTAVYLAVDMRSRGGGGGAGPGAGAGGGRAGPAAPAGVRPTDGPAARPQYSALQLAQRLLDMGVDPNPQLNMHRAFRGRFSDDLLTTGCTPLLRAAFTHDVEAVELLLKHGALPDLPNVMGVTPLMAAAGIGRGEGGSASGVYARGTPAELQANAIAVINLLIGAGADVNARITDTSSRTAVIARPSSMTDRQGQTAIFGAIGNSWTRVAGFLIEHGARLDVKDDAGRTVFDALERKAGGRDPEIGEDTKALIRRMAGAS